MSPWLLALTLWVAQAMPSGHPDDLSQRALNAIRLGSAALSRLAVGGGYASRQAVEGRARFGPDGQPLGPTQWVVGPGGTVVAGQGHLAVFAATGDLAAQAAAVEVAHALARTQLESGGWAVLADPVADDWTRQRAQAGQPPAERANRSEWSPAVSPAALTFLDRVATLVGDAESAQAAQYGRLRLLAQQRPDGAWFAGWPSATADADTAATAAAVQWLAHSDWPVAVEAALQGGEWLLAARQASGWSASGALDAVVDEAATVAALGALAELHGNGYDRRWLTTAQEVLAHRPQRGPELLAAAARVGAVAAGQATPPDDRAARAWRTSQRTRAVAAALGTLEPGGGRESAEQLVTQTYADHLVLLADYVREYEPLPSEFTDEPARPAAHGR